MVDFSILFSQVPSSESAFFVSFSCDFARAATSVRSIRYSAAAMGTLMKMPRIPIMPPPTVIAASTQIPGRPMDVPTTLG